MGQIWKPRLIKPPPAARPTTARGRRDLIAAWHFSDMPKSGGTTIDSSGHHHTVTLAGNVAPVIGKYGPGLTFGGGGDDHCTVAGVISPRSITMEASGILVSSSDVYQIIVSDNGGINKWVMMVHRDNYLGMYIDSSGAAYEWAPDNDNIFGYQRHMVCTYDEFTGIQAVYLDGVFQSSNTIGGAGPIDAQSNTPYIGGSGFHIEGTLDFVRIYRRALYATEIAELFLDPFIDFRPISVVIILGSQSGGPQALAGQIDVTTTVTGAIGVTRSIAGQVDAQTALTGTLGLKREVSGQVDVATSMSGTLSVTRGLAGQVDVTTTASGTLTAGIGLAGQVDAQVSMTGAMGTALALAGQVDVTTTVAGALGLSTSLAGQIDAAVALSGAIDLSLGLAGQIDVTTTLAGDLSVVGEVDLRGQIDVAVGITGALSVQYPLAGQVDVTTALTGRLGLAHALAGQIDVATTVAGALTNPVPWYYPSSYTVTAGNYNSGTLLDVRQEDATYLHVEETNGSPALIVDFTFGEDVPLTHTGWVLHITCRYEGNPAHVVKLQQWNYDTSSWVNVTAAARDFQSSAVDVSYLFKLIDDPDYLSGGQIKLRFNHTSVGNQNHDFYWDFMGLGTSLSAAAAVSTTLSGNLTAVFALAGQIDAQTSLTGNLGVVFGLAGQIDVLTTLAGSLSNSIGLSGQVDCVISLAGLLGLPISLAGQIDAVVTASGTMLIVQSISGQIAVVVTPTGALQVQRALAGSVDVTTTMIGNMIAQWALAGTIPVQVTLAGEMEGVTEPYWFSDANLTGVHNIIIGA